MSKPTRKVMAALEKVFAAEISGQLPFQAKAKIYQQLAENGLLERVIHKFGSGWSAVTVEGYVLTHAGRFLYCQNCEAPDEI